MGLTAKQQKFVDSYVESGNATKAALDAGYSKHTARSVGSENLTKPDIKAAIAEQVKRLQDAKIAKADEVLQYLTTVLRGTATETVNVGTAKGVFTVDDNPPTIKDRMAAGRELLKRYPDSDELLKAQIKRAKADADVAAARAAAFTNDGNGDEYKLVVDIPDKDGEDDADIE